MLDFLLNALLPAKLLQFAVIPKENETVEESTYCIADFWVRINPDEPTQPIAMSLADRSEAPIVSAIEETLEVLDADGRVDFVVLPGDEVASLSGSSDDPWTVATHLPTYRPDRKLLVYPDVLRWIERFTERELDDLVTFDGVRTVTFGEEGVSIGCSELKGAARPGRETEQRVAKAELMKEIIDNEVKETTANWGHKYLDLGEIVAADARTQWKPELTREVVMTK